MAINFVPTALDAAKLRQLLRCYASKRPCYSIARITSFLMLLIPGVSFADQIEFTCTWNEAKPITISIDTEKRIGSRSDGGSAYEVIKVTDYVVWLSIVDPKNQMGLATQMIQRRKATNGKAGKWLDVVHSVTGAVSPIDGGICWEDDA